MNISVKFNRDTWLYYKFKTTYDTFIFSLSYLNDDALFSKFINYKLEVVPENM